MLFAARTAALLRVGAQFLWTSSGRAALGLLLATGAVAAGGEPRILTNQWSFLLPQPSDSSPAIGADGTIYLGTWNGDLRAFRPNGQPKWVFHAGREIASSPAVGTDGTIYFGSRDRKLHALGPDGKSKWEFTTQGWVDSSPALSDSGTVYFGSWDGSFYAVDIRGTKKWEFKTGAEIVSSPAISFGETVYFGSHDKSFYALSNTGAKKWSYPTGGPITSSPAIDGDGTIYFSSVDGFFYALRPEGTLKWRLKTGGISESSPVIGQDGTLFIGVNNELWAVSPDGKKKWDQSYGGELIVSAPMALIDGSVCCVSRAGFLVNLSIPHQFNWTYDQNFSGTLCPAVGTQGMLYTVRHVSDVGTMFCAVSANAVLASSPWPKFRGNSENTGNALRNKGPATVAGFRVN